MLSFMNGLIDILVKIDKDVSI